MPVSILVIDTKYRNEFKNGVGFASNPGDFTTNLSGSVMENVRITRTININWFFAASTGNGVTSTPLGGGFFQIARTSGNWVDDGFAVGDRIRLAVIVNTGPVTASGPITSITANIMIVTGPFFDSSLNGWVNASVVIKGLEPQTALTYRFGLIGNSENFNTQSKVSLNDQAYYGDQIGFDTGGGVRDTNFVTLNRLGIYEDWRTGSVRARFVQSFGGVTNDETQQFEIEHTFTIVPYYLDGELPNLQNNVIPPLLNGGASLKYVFNALFQTVLSNSNTKKSKEYEESLGDVAWFNEVLNGFNSDYNILSVTYEEKITGANASGILIGGETRIRVTVGRISGPFTGIERFGGYISYLPDQAEYTNTTLSNLKDNFLYDNALNFTLAGPVPGQDFITAISGLVNLAGDLQIIIDTEYSAIQKAFLSQKFAIQPTLFLLGIQIGDDTLSSAATDRLILLADVELYDQSPDIEDLMHVTRFDIYPHNEQIGTGVGFTDMVAWNEDAWAVNYEFDLDLNKNALLNTLEFKVLAFNPTTLQLFELDSFAFSPATAIISGGVQQIILNTTRGYILLGGDQFNEVTIGVGPQFGGLQEYSGRFAQKVPWQEWVANLNADTIFFNAAEPNNNLNDKSSNYSLLNGYEIRMAIFANVFGTSPLGVSGVTDYLFLSPNIIVFDYEKDGLIPPVWSCVIETFDAINLTNLGGSILSGIDTLFRVTWTDSNGPVASLADIYGINRIEVTLQPGFAITEMSSINAPLPTGQQLLKPSVGTLLDLTLVGGLVIMECLIDGSLVVPGTNYNLSSRIQHDIFFPPVGGKALSPSGVIKDTSGLVPTIKTISP